ncbi:hypothetical protein HDU76_008610 [Blyttiomyces sp. JEL0837]|nr:hypothetical protein HDU76_008610 [Blyttiomyces sp. JEL0837]
MIKAMNIYSLIAYPILPEVQEYFNKFKRRRLALTFADKDLEDIFWKTHNKLFRLEWFYLSILTGVNRVVLVNQAVINIFGIQSMYNNCRDPQSREIAASNFPSSTSPFSQRRNRPHAFKLD